MRTGWTEMMITHFVESLRLFKIGYSWGGTTSHVMTYPPLSRRKRDYGGRLIRLNVGLEDQQDLIEDLRQAFNAAGG